MSQRLTWAMSVAELAEESDWSVAQAAKVLKAFDDQGWTVKQGTSRGPGAHRRLVDADGMLAAWSAARNFASPSGSCVMRETQEDAPAREHSATVRQQ